VREHRRRAHPLEDPGPDQHCDGTRQRAHDAAGREQEDPGADRGPPAEAPGRDQEHGRRHQEGQQQQLHAGGGGAELQPDRG
jgi:hypothetical protein